MKFLVGAHMGNPLVSVLIVTYNQEQYVKEALVSALDQDYANLQVVVADDASSDDTRKIIIEIARKYPPNRLSVVLNPKNLGITGNSNNALRYCRGELIAFMGGDDVLLPGKISRQVEWFAQEERRVLCGHDVEWIGPRGELLGARSSDFVPLNFGQGASGFIKNGSPYAATSIMVRRSRIPDYGLHPWLPLVADWKLWIDVICEDGVYGYVPGIWAQYRRHSANVTARRSWKIIRDVLLTALLSLWHLRGRFIIDWAYYFLVRPLAKRMRKNE